jgi:uncharacterized membrane protein YfcA
VDWKLSVAGLLIGLLVGMTGMGGGSLMTPMLVLVFGFKPSVGSGPTSSTARSSSPSAPRGTALSGMSMPG